MLPGAERHADADLLRALADGVGHHGINAHCRQDHANRSENQEQGTEQPRVKARPGEVFRQGQNVYDGDVRVGAADHISHRCDQRMRIVHAAARQHHDVALRVSLAIGNIDQGTDLRLLAGEFLPHVRRHSDHRQPRRLDGIFSSRSVGIYPEPETFADGVFAGPMLGDKTLVDDGGGLSRQAVAVREGPAAPQGNSHHPKVFGIDDHAGNRRRLLGVRHRVAFQLQRPLRGPAQGKTRRQRHRFRLGDGR